MESLETAAELVDDEQRLIGPRRHQSFNRRFNPCFNFRLITGWKRSLQLEIILKVLRVAILTASSIVYAIATENAGTPKVSVLLREITYLCQIALVFPALGVFALTLALFKKQWSSILILAISEALVMGTGIAFIIYFARYSKALRKEIISTIGHPVEPGYGMGLLERGVENIFSDICNVLNIVFPCVDLCVWSIWICWLRALQTSTTVLQIANSQAEATASIIDRHHIIVTNMQI